MKTIRFPLVALLVCAACFAVDTRFWQQADRADFERGTLKRLSLRGDGRLFISPELTEVFDSTTPYLWTLAADSKGTLYTAGGGSGSGSAKVFAIDRNGKSRTFAELDGLEIHALVLDSNGALYAATDPDGKVYKIAADGKPKLFYDPRQKYIWAMAFAGNGDLFIATGDQGEIHRVTPAGVGSVFFKTEETHARSLAIDAQNNLIVGTEPSGLILRISSPGPGLPGQGFVLYQSPKREITAVAIQPDGAIYAAGVGNKIAIAQAAPPPSPAPSVPAGGTAGPGNARNVSVASGPSLVGGSEVYRINPDGSPRTIWTGAQDVVYAIGFDAAGLPLLGTGNRGKIYRLDSDSLSTLLLEATPTQVTGFGRDPKGGLFAVTGNIGKVLRIGPGFEKNGTFESDVLDAGSFTYWGRINYRGAGKISVFTRSGNRSHPESNWSPWAPLQTETSAPACDSCGGGRAVSPPARFLQYKIELTPGSGPAPEVSYVEVAYLPKNVAPVVETVDVTPANYRFPQPVLAIPPSTSITLPPIGQPRSPAPSGEIANTSQSMSYAKGFEGARWLASDENNDTLVYRVEIRGVQESGWKLLKENVKERYLSWDTGAFPDGEYVLRVTASDSPSNPPAQALSASLVSDPFLIDNTPPQIFNLAGSPASGNKLDIHWSARDARSAIDRAEYSVNGGEWMLIDPLSRLSDSPQEEYHLVIDRPSADEQVIAVRVSDEFDNQAVDKIVVK
jgi:sugar lactone lactonase YvrE